MKGVGMALALSLTIAACTNYVDAILPPPLPDAAIDSDGPVEIFTPLVQMDEKFGEGGRFVLSVTSHDEVVDALALPDGTIVVLLKEDCTLVAVSSQGGLRSQFLKGGILRGENGCDGQSLTYDEPRKRLLLATNSNPITIMRAYNVDGSPSMTLQDGDKVKVDINSVGSVLPTQSGLLLAAPSPQKLGIALTSLDAKGTLINRQTVDTGGVPNALLLYETFTKDTFLLADVPSKDASPNLSLFIAPTSGFATIGPSIMIDPLATTGSALEVITRAKAGPDGQPLVLGLGWQKADPLVRTPFVWAPNLKSFGQLGAAGLLGGDAAAYVDLAYRAGIIAVTGTEGVKNERKAVLTGLDGNGNLDRHFIMPAVFILPFPDPSTATKVLFTSDDAIVIVGSLGFEGNASLFVSRVLLN